MRNFGWLLLSLREAERNENAGKSQFLCPDKFDDVVHSVMKISNFDVKRGEKEVATPSLALHISHSLKKCIGIVRVKALRLKDKSLLEDVEHFEKLMKAERNDHITISLIYSLSQVTFRS